MSYFYRAHIVTDQEYLDTHIDDWFKGGIVINGLAGIGDDCLLVTAHPTDVIVVELVGDETWVK